MQRQLINISRAEGDPNSQTYFNPNSNDNKHFDTSIDQLAKEGRPKASTIAHLFAWDIILLDSSSIPNMTDDQRQKLNQIVNDHYPELDFLVTDIEKLEDQYQTFVNYFDTESCNLDITNDAQWVEFVQIHNKAIDTKEKLQIDEQRLTKKAQLIDSDHPASN